MNVNNEMKEKYRGIAKKFVKETHKDEEVIEQIIDYTHAYNSEEARRNLIYKLQNNKGVYLGEQKNESSYARKVWWELVDISIVREVKEMKETKDLKDYKINFEELEKKENEELEIIKFNEEEQLYVSNMGKLFKNKNNVLVEVPTRINGKTNSISNNGTTINVSTIVYTTFKGKVEGVNRYQFTYKDGDSFNSKLSNLELSNATKKEKRFYVTEKELEEKVQEMIKKIINKNGGDR